jgi:hypothetical protein
VASRFLRQRKLTEDTLLLMNIAPCPGRGWDRAHDRMLRHMKMLGGVLAGRGIATADVAARLALAKSNPTSSFRQALLASARSILRGKVLCAEACQMFT